MQLYDKRDDFPFSLVRMPHLASNIPLKMFYSGFGSEIFRAVCTTVSLFRQGGNITVFAKTLAKMR